VFFGFAHDLESFFTVNNSRDPRFMDVYEWDLTTLRPVLIYRNVDGLMPSGISPDKRWLALGKANTTNDSDLLLQDLGSDAPPVLLSEHEGMASFAFEDFSADSRFLYYTSNAQGEVATLWRYDLGTGTHEEVLATSWDVAYASISHDGTYRVVATNEDGYTRIRVTDMSTGEDLSLPQIAGGTIDGAGISRSESKILLTVSSDTMPRNLFLYDIESGTLTQLTDTLDPSIDTADLVPAEVVRFTARDGLEIPGLLYRPLGATAEDKVPALVMVHGGPGGQSRPGYSAERQLLINHGYAVFAVNNRGSSG
jgi:dipeptidyl aminopeptidase/acylaminoacyl peptidase